MIKIAPSILSSDFSNLESEIKRLEKSNADIIHIDVMDGHFVNNITIGPAVISSIRDKTNLLFDIHLMIEEPDRYLKEFVKSGADLVTIHYESSCDIRKTLEMIKQTGKMAGLALKPKTEAKVIEEYLDVLDLVLVMTVEPGFGGQAFIKDMLPKIKQVRKYIESRERSIYLEVDGGINEVTAKDVMSCGANVIVAGSYIFKSDDYEHQINMLKS